MESFRAPFFPAIFLMALLLIASGELGGPSWGVEGRICESQSHKFKGPCIRRSNCAGVCRTEGFPGGRCRGFRRRCFCVRQCWSSTVNAQTTN